MLIRFSLFSCVLLIASLCGCSPVKWEHDYQAGVQRASQLRRRALIQVFANFSPECREMDEEVFSDPDVQKLIQNFVPIRVDSVMDRQLTEQLGVQVVPTFIVIRPDLTVAGSYGGKLSAEKFRFFLIKHMYD